MWILFDAYQYVTDEMQIKYADHIKFHDLTGYFINFNINLILNDSSIEADIVLKIKKINFF